MSLRGHKNAGSGPVGGFREAGVGIAQASHGGRSIGRQGRCDFVAESCPLTIPLLLINRRHLNAQDACAPPKSSSALRQPQHLGRTKNADSSPGVTVLHHSGSHRSRFRLRTRGCSECQGLESDRQAGSGALGLSRPYSWSCQCRSTNSIIQLSSSSGHLHRTRGGGRFIVPEDQPR
jgi:hypothetical protein